MSGPFKIWNGKPFKAIKRELIMEVYLYFDCSLTDTSHALGIGRSVIYDALKSYGAAGFMDPFRDPSPSKTAALMKEFPDAKRSYEEKKKMLQKLYEVDRGEKI